MSISKLRSCIQFYMLTALLAICLFPNILFADEKENNLAIMPTAAAGPLIPEHIVLDGQEYTRDDLISAFLEISFSSYIRSNIFPDAVPLPPYSADLCAAKYQPSSPSPKSALRRWSTLSDGVLVGDSEICSTPAEVKQRYPWLYEFLYREHGFPRYFAINKWSVPIRVSIGYPDDLIPLLTSEEAAEQAVSKRRSGLWISDFAVESARHRPNSPQFSPPEKKQAAMETTKIAIEEIQTDVPVLAGLTGLPVSYLPHAQESGGNLANVRIVIADNLADWKTQFKRDRVMPAGEIPTVRTIYGTAQDSLYRTSVQFSEIEHRLVTKVPFTPTSDQQLDGFFLPVADNTIGMSFCFIGNKNSPDIVRALVRECLIRSLGLPNPPRVKPTMTLGLWNDQTSNLAKAEGWASATPPITEFDSFMIKLLYNAAVKPGISTNELYVALKK